MGSRFQALGEDRGETSEVNKESNDDDGLIKEILDGNKVSNQKNNEEIMREINNNEVFVSMYKETNEELIGIKKTSLKVINDNGRQELTDGIDEGIYLEKQKTTNKKSDKKGKHRDQKGRTKKAGRLTIRGITGFKDTQNNEGPKKRTIESIFKTNQLIDMLKHTHVNMQKENSSKHVKIHSMVIVLELVEDNNCMIRNTQMSHLQEELRGLHGKDATTITLTHAARPPDTVKDGHVLGVKFLIF